MAIANIYSEVILEQVIRQILDDGIDLSVAEIETRYNAFVANRDLSQPLFDISVAEVIPLESYTANKRNKTNLEIASDLSVLYKELFSITDDSIKSFDRWRTELGSLQSQIDGIETRIDDLLRTQIEHNVHFIIDNFLDASLIDTSNTTALLSIKENTIGLNLSNVDPTRIILNSITSNDVQFTVLSRQNLQSVISSANALPVNALLDTNVFWQTKVIMFTNKLPVTTELLITISEVPRPVSKIIFKLHSSNTSGFTQITPLLSSDGVNFVPLNVTNPTQSVANLTTWSFPSVDTTVVKFIITKNGHDIIENNNFIYEFGAEEIAFYNESFDTTSTQVFYSNVLSAVDISNKVIPFNSVSLEVCERIPTNTAINYFIAALLIPTDTPIWTRVEPISRTNKVFPSTINFGNVKNITIDALMVSFDSTGETDLVNPGSTFDVVDLSSGIPVSSTRTISDRRYVFANSNERILDHEINNSVNIDRDSVEVFRNVGIKGDTLLVRNIQRGWTFTDPYYVTNIQIFSENGLSVDFGDQSVIIDNDTFHSKVLLNKGIHNIKVHKNNWLPISTGISSMDALKIADRLFPFNHKYLIEGYELPLSDNPYKGVDIFAGYYMKQISIYEFSNKIPVDDYSKFALDTNVLSPEPNTVFVVKSNESFSDFLDELFTIRFNVQHQLYNYLKLKAELSTTDTSVSPNFDGYKLKIST